jgi:hypothetical protein
LSVRLFSIFNRGYDKIKVCKGKQNQGRTSIIFGAGGLTGIGGAYISHRSPFIGIAVCVTVGVESLNRISTSTGDD